MHQNEPGPVIVACLVDCCVIAQTGHPPEGDEDSDQVEEYLVQLVLASRDPAPYNSELARLVSYGASPRATIALDRCSRAHAWLHGQDYVTPDDVQAVAADVLRHRLLLSFEAEANGVTPDDVTRELLVLVPVG